MFAPCGHFSTMNFSGSTLCEAFASLLQLDGRHHNAIRVLLEQATRTASIIDTCGLPEMERMLTICINVGGEGRTVAPLVTRLCHHGVLSDLPGVQTVMLMWCLGQLGLRSEEATASLVARILCPDVRHHLSATEVATVVWSVAMCGHRNPELMNRMAERLLQIPTVPTMPSEVEPPDGMTSALSATTVLWSFVHLDVEHPELFVTLGTQCSEACHHLGVQDVTIIAWCLAASRIAVPALMGAVRDRLVAGDDLVVWIDAPSDASFPPHAQDLRPTHLVTIAWSLATLGDHAWAHADAWAHP